MKKSVMLVVLLLMSTLMFAQRGAYRGGHDRAKGQILKQWQRAAQIV